MYSFPTHKILPQTTHRFLKLSSLTRGLEVICADGAREITCSSRCALKLRRLELSKPSKENEAELELQNKYHKKIIEFISIQKYYVWEETKDSPQ